MYFSFFRNQNAPKAEKESFRDYCDLCYIPLCQFPFLSSRTARVLAHPPSPRLRRTGRRKGFLNPFLSFQRFWDVRYPDEGRGLAVTQSQVQQKTTLLTSACILSTGSIHSDETKIVNIFLLEKLFLFSAISTLFGSSQIIVRLDNFSHSF